MGRDLINTPMIWGRPLAAAAAALAAKWRARPDDRGAALAKGFPLVHAVGKGAAGGPRSGHPLEPAQQMNPKVTLVGRASASTPATSTSNPTPPCF